MATTSSIELNASVRIKQKEDNGEYQGLTGALVHIDPYADGDFYGVQFPAPYPFPGENSIVYFYRRDFEVQHG